MPKCIDKVLAEITPTKLKEIEDMIYTLNKRARLTKDVDMNMDVAASVENVQKDITRAQDQINRKKVQLEREKQKEQRQQQQDQQAQERQQSQQNTTVGM